MVAVKNKRKTTSNENLYNFKRSFKNHKYAYIMVLPVALIFLLFNYIPMIGVIIAFKEYTPSMGIIASKWCGFKYFIQFFNDPNFFRVIRNTLVISVGDLLINFPGPIILALLFNEIKNKPFKLTVQTISYFPHFISLVVICGMIKSFTMSDGIITNILASLTGMEAAPLLRNADFFRPIYILSATWKDIGWNSIIYLAALGAIDSQLYEACQIDGGGKWRQTIHVTLPGITPTIVVLLLLRIGQIVSVGYEKIILLYNPTIYEKADVISTFLYRKGLQELNWSYSTAVGLFNSVINFTLLILANKASKKVNGLGLW